MKKTESDVKESLTTQGTPNSGLDDSPGYAGSFAVAADLLKEVCDAHSDPESPEWNDCGTPENDCEWCRMAKEWVSAQNVQGQATADHKPKAHNKT